MDLYITPWLVYLFRGFNIAFQHNCIFSLFYEGAWGTAFQHSYFPLKCHIPKLVHIGHVDWEKPLTCSSLVRMTDENIQTRVTNIYLENRKLTSWGTKTWVTANSLHNAGLLITFKMLVVILTYFVQNVTT